MLYRVFNTEKDVSEANGIWAGKRWEAGGRDRKKEAIVNPQITNCWSYGKTMVDGRIACKVPINYADDFGGLELNLTENDFPKVESEV